MTEDGREQTLLEHCENTAELSADFAADFGAGDLAYQTGLLHDIGKYSKEFQKYLRGAGSSPDHSTAGCQEALRLGGPFSAFCIAGHHSGLPNHGNTNDSPDSSTLMGRKKKSVADYSSFKEQIQPGSFPRPKLKTLKPPAFGQCLFTRMLYSCLVDADFLDTEEFMRDGSVRRGGFDELPALLERLEQRLSDFDPNANGLNRKRCDILKQCCDMSSNGSGLYTLTVPTGGGKTISSMAFALKHAVKHSKKRIIYVIPYTSIIEQTADVFRGILSDENVLEHHSNVDYTESGNGEAIPDKMRLAAENWDAPVVVTTNVQFFESLFANRSSRCRKLHNIANSVIVFDEAQMLPLNYLKPCVQAIAELVANYKVSAVLCTATQPALEPYFPPDMPISEIVPNASELYEDFKRVTIQIDGSTDEDTLAQELSERRQVLCIVNSRRKAARLYTACADESCFHLSTLMTPRHRRAVLKNVRSRLKNDQPCRLISTTVVEAGVDVDFPEVYREQSGLDSILQAAGRCNREGRRSAEDSIVHVFSLSGIIPSVMQQTYGMMQETAKIYEDISTPEAIHDYFCRLYKLSEDELDSKDIMKLSNGFAFETVAQDFKMIENDTRSIFVPLDDEAVSIAERLRNGEYSRTLLRQTAPYLVNVYPEHMTALAGAGALTPIKDDLAILEDMSLYSSDTGIQLDIESGMGLFI